MKPDPPAWWQESYFARRAILERKLSAGGFYAISEAEDENLRFLTDNLEDASKDFGGYWPPFIIEGF
jgi:hypothetical protein